METKDGFQEAEDLGRTLFNQVIAVQDWCSNVKFTEDKFCPNDVFYSSGDTRIVGEIKYRYYLSTKYPDWMIEDHKIKDLQRIMKFNAEKYPNRKYAIQYINFYPDNVCRIWTVTDLGITEQTVTTTCGKTTCGDTSLKSKETYYLDNNLAVFTTKYGYNC